MIDANLRAIEPVSYESSSVVPTGYAEKAMASLMQLHSELMDEKERRVDLYRRLMDKEQVLAELRMYVELLEEKLAARHEGWEPPRESRSAETVSESTAAPRSPREGSSARMYRASAFAAAASLNSATRGSATSDGWKAW